MKNGFVALTLSAATAAGMVLAGSQYPAAGKTDSSTQLVDAEFEHCLRKKFQKRFFNRIDATDEQAEQLSSLFAQRMDSTRPAREELRGKFLELVALASNKDAGDQAVLEKVEQLRNLHQQIMDKRIETLLQVRSILTQDQLSGIEGRIRGLVTGNWKPMRLKTML